MRDSPPAAPAMDFVITPFFKSILLVAGALIPIMNPPGGAAMFLSMTAGESDTTRNHMAGRIAVNGFILLVAAMFVGTHVLAFFDISLPVVKVAGGILVAAAGWQMLRGGDSVDSAPTPAAPGNPSGRAFFPLTFPLLVGPGTISVAITIGASLPGRGVPALVNSLAAALGALAVCLIVYVTYRFAPRLLALLGGTGMVIFLRLSSFMLLCIGVQILWDGLSELLQPWRVR